MTRTFRRLLAFTLLLTVLTASPTRAQLHNAGDPCPEPTAGRIFTQEGSAGPSLVCNGTTLEVDESISTGPYARGIGTAAPKAPLHVAGEVIVGPTTGLACDANREGALRWKTTAPKCIEICDGSSWACMASGASCDNTLISLPFAAQTDLPVSTLVMSNIVAITGMDAGCTVPVSISGTGGSPEYRVCSTSNCSSVVQTWTAATNTLDMQGKYLQLRATTSAVGGTTSFVTVAVGPVMRDWSITADCGHSPAGTVCADGTVYAGTSPASSTPMYVTRCDAGRTWGGSACTGGRGLYTWNNGNATGNVDTSLSNCQSGWGGCAATADGRANTNTLAAEDSDSGVGGVQPHEAAAYCDSLNIHGHADWYLPSLPELDVIVRANNPDLTNGTADDNRLGDFVVGDYYWSSSEYSSGQAWYENSGNGSQTPNTKGGALYVRCARR